MVDSDISHEMESRFRNIEAHLGIGKTDEETGEYSVQAHSDTVPEEPEEPEQPETPEV